MIEKSIIYNPMIPIAPGETLLELIEEKNITQVDLARRMGRPIKVINEIIKGRSSITAETALQLEKVLGVPARFWNNLESNYQEIKARIKNQEMINAEIDISKSYPYAEMAKMEWVILTDKPSERVMNLQSFFAVNSLENIIEKMLIESNPLYRRSFKKTMSPYAAAAWLRKGVIESKKIDIKEFNEQKLREAVPKIRALTIEKVEIMQTKVEEILSDCGVAFTITPSLKNVPINGVSRWMSPTKALIQLSIFNKFCDIFWFSLFHEIGHILCHGKKDINIDFRNGSENQNDKELQADQFASDILIPKEEFKSFIQTNDYALISIKKFAQEQKIDPSIVIGRLQHLGKIPFNKYTHFKTRFAWANGKG